MCKVYLENLKSTKSSSEKANNCNPRKYFPSAKVDLSGKYFNYHFKLLFLNFYQNYFCFVTASEGSTLETISQQQ